MRSIIFFLLASIILAVQFLQWTDAQNVINSSRIEQNRSFTIDFENDTFLMDGKPFRFVAGSMHYFRTPHQYWRDRMRALRAAGLNAVTTYVEWSFHEPEKGSYRWEGDHDLVRYINIAKEEGLYVILRPGPYICAERDMGGFPYWILNLYPKIKLRTNDQDYKFEVTRWYTQLMSRMQPLLYGNGGPIIMVQVENEYGSFEACDSAYMIWLAALTRQWVNQDAVMFTTDGNSKSLLRCGTTPDAYPTVDFGSGTNPSDAWKVLRKFAPSGPLINSEYYTGWLTHWSEDMQSTEPGPVVDTLNIMLEQMVNINFYMFHGGTNFDYTAGANFNDNYLADITSYDYDAPLTEAGDPTPKYLLIREALKEYMPMPDYPPPNVKPKGSWGPFTLEPVLALMKPEGRSKVGRSPSQWMLPPTMEAVGQRSGLILYEATLPANRTNQVPLTIPDLRDRALIYIDGEYIGILNRTQKKYTINITADQGNTLQILVESQGRINYGHFVNDFKGIIGNATLSDKPILGWTVTSFPLEVSGLESEFMTSKLFIRKDQSFLNNAQKRRDVTKRIIDKSGNSNQASSRQVESRGAGIKLNVTTSGILKQGPVFYIAKFQLGNMEPMDTYLNVFGWGKGFAWINERHLGRYWPNERPQVTLYTPGVYLKKHPEWNTIVLLELQKAPANMSITFISRPIFI